MMFCPPMERNFSMKVYRLLPVAAIALAACSGDSTSKFVAPDPHAAIRWVNAVPDTMPMDYRFVDIVTNASAASIAYRGTSGSYVQLPPGSHRIRVFLAGTTTAGNGPSIVTTVVLDTTLTFVVNHYYTILHEGYMKASASPKHKLVLLDDVFPSPPAGSVAFRGINAHPVAIDIYGTVASATGGAVTGTPLFANLAAGAASAYVAATTAPASPAAATYRITSTPAGSSTPILADALAPVGAAKIDSSATSAAFNPVAGTKQDGSVLTFIATPPAVAYTMTASGTNSNAAGTLLPVNPTGALAAPAIISLLDKNPKDKLLGQ
jgi:uncharacterized protein DUF4397